MALELAQRFRGEVICADSRTVHEELNLAAGKPSVYDQLVVPHHGLDVVPLDGFLSGPEFAMRCGQWIDDISERGKIPIVCGGGLLSSSLVR